MSDYITKDQAARAIVLNYLHMTNEVNFAKLHLDIYYASAALRYWKDDSFRLEFDDDIEFPKLSYPSCDAIRDALRNLSSKGLVDIIKASNGNSARLTDKGRKTMDKEKNYRLNKKLKKALGSHPTDIIPL